MKHSETEATHSLECGNFNTSQTELIIKLSCSLPYQVFLSNLPNLLCIVHVAYKLRNCFISGLSV